MQQYSNSHNNHCIAVPVLSDLAQPKHNSIQLDIWKSRCATLHLEYTLSAWECVTSSLEMEFDTTDHLAMVLYDELAYIQ